MADPKLVDAASLPPPRLAEIPPMKCCCGSLECVFLRHNCSVLDNVEKDVHNAARMGQALLARHEAYMADAERDRSELTSRIEQLEADNKELEMTNVRTIEENRTLLDQLESLNSTINQSEGRVKSLEASLLSSQQTIRRLEAETARAEALERQIATLEQEQADLQGTLTLSREEARSALSRWKRAERGINDLQEQLERIEREAREEKEHHMEMISRIEKQREMEKELNTAAGRLKGAAAAKVLNHGAGSGQVVGHFVRDLLQDNATLQHGIAELREMLMNSNDEIQALRDQLEYHQPFGDGEGSATPTLRAELEPVRSPEPKVSQELHIHHHYHVSAPKYEIKKPRKKRLGLAPSVFAPPVISHPNTPPNGFVRQSSASAVSHARKDSLTRWSTFSEQPSEFAPSSAPSSPRSNNRNSVFDPPGGSFPGSPTTSVDPMSPRWPPGHKRQPSNMSSRSFQIPTSFPFGPTPATIAHPIAEESDGLETLGAGYISTTDDSVADDEGSSGGVLGTINDDSSLGHDETDSDCAQPPVGRLRRTMSHESILSLSGGLDIHTLKSRPSQLTIRQIGSASSVTASSIVTARPMLSRDNAKRSSMLLRDKYASSSYSPVGSLRAVSNPSAAATPPSSRVGSWTGWRPWGGGGGSKAVEQQNPGGAGIKEKEKSLLSRPPGINQPGTIPGFTEFLVAAQKRGPVGKTQPDVVDQEALREGLSE
ncbi:hypothetical protein F5Y16DRAFT_243071 [Xylariaceae sp. FL0255]|nr:hypothetical protein F5Y16DRAFT_243071 [Xylariaceae sp. FL0255]